MNCKCGNSTESPSGLCKGCLERAAEKFWDFVESHKKKRLDIIKKALDASPCQKRT